MRGEGEGMSDNIFFPSNHIFVFSVQTSQNYTGMQENSSSIVYVRISFSRSTSVVLEIFFSLFFSHCNKMFGLLIVDGEEFVSLHLRFYPMKGKNTLSAL